MKLKHLIMLIMLFVFHLIVTSEFCWMCLGNWNEHNREYYECSIYKENPSMVKKKSGTLKAREALTKYLFYYERVRKSSGFIFHFLSNVFNMQDIIHKLTHNLLGH